MHPCITSSVPPPTHTRFLCLYHAQVLLLSDLQEASPNVDTFSLSQPHALPPLNQLHAVVNSPADKVTTLSWMPVHARFISNTWDSVCMSVCVCVCVRVRLPVRSRFISRTSDRVTQIRTCLSAGDGPPGRQRQPRAEENI